MFVDTALLHSGASASYRAGGDAQKGAEYLRRAPLTAGMFGDFAAADRFHQTVTAATAHHVKVIRSHQETLSGVVREATHVAAALTAMEDRNEQALRDVRCA